MRVHELAKELSLSSKEIVAKFQELGIDAKSHMSNVDDEAAELLRLSLEPEDKATAAPAEEKQEPAAAEPEDQAAPEPEDQAAPEAEEPTAEAEEPTVEAEEVGELEADGKKLIVQGAVVVKDLAEKLDMRPNQLIAELMSLNVFASINQKLDIKIAQKIAAKHGLTVEIKKIEKKTMLKAWEEESEEVDLPEDMKSRAPVVTFLGHVDHGKTSLLDQIRNAKVAAGEAGGITQHIGAYTIDVNGHMVTFLDTPGHAAFTAMRARGANLTDIATIIVAADDGIMPQTKEAIQHAQAAGATIMVAINKMDLPGANPDNVKQQLQVEGLTPEDWGGEVVCCPVSAQTGDGIDDLLEMIVMQSEMLDLRSNPSKRASGYVIESKLEPGMGPTANLLVKEGTLKVGDAVLCGPHWGKIKALIDDRGNKIKSAGPSVPVKCLGLSGVPEAGAEFRVCANDKKARSLAQNVQEDLRTKEISAPARQTSLDNLFEQLEMDEKVELKLVLKADVQGSLQAIKHTLASIPSEKISLNILLAGVGNITVNDILLASASSAIVIGFNVAVENGVNASAKREGVEIRLHSIIYELTDEIRASMTGLLAPETVETVVGHAQVLQVFPITKVGRIAGCSVTDGSVRPKSKVRVKRGGDVLYEGGIMTLRRFQNDASEVRAGQECGIRLTNFGDFEDEDILEFFELEKVEQTL